MIIIDKNLVIFISLRRKEQLFKFFVHYAEPNIADYCVMFIEKVNNWVGIIKVIALPVITLSSFPHAAGIAYFLEFVISKSVIFLVLVVCRLFFYFSLSANFSSNDG
jgi:hypothetical protein